MITSPRNSNIILLYFLAFFFIASAIAGAINAYTPVPYWDMWSSYLNSYTKFLDGDWSIWWAQHNEHRILLAKLFFWMDLTWFRGDGWFLLTVNYTLMLIACFTFIKIWYESDFKSEKWFPAFIIIWLFSWCQSENLTWGFQSQFILAQLIPLVAFYLQHKSIQHEHDGKFFFLACIFGVLATGSMANGVLALPIMLLCGVIANVNKKRLAIILALTLLTLWLYFHNYTSPPKHGSLLNSLHEDPLAVFHYILLYIGGPFFYFFGKSQAAEVIATIAGGCLIFFAIFYFCRILKNIKLHTLELSMLAFILYIGGTAIGTAGGRVFLGIDQALSSRYMTPSLMAWMAAFILFMHTIKNWPRVKKVVWLFCVLLALSMIPLQIRAFHSEREHHYQQELAALALSLRVADQQQISTVYPSAATAIKLSEAASKRHISIFSHEPYKFAIENSGKKVLPAANKQNKCIGSVDEVMPIQDEEKYVRIRGWVYDETKSIAPGYAFLLGEDSTLIGVILPGMARPDVAKAISPAAEQSGFYGYIDSKYLGKPVTIYNPEIGCIGQANTPNFLFYTKTTNLPADIKKLNATALQIRENNGWNGSDFSHSKFKELAILGSRINSDADTGSITIRMNKGDKILYRSGPTSGNQTLHISDGKDFTAQLPTALEWIILDFSSPILPDHFTATFADSGTAWGEWSAIGIKE